MKKLLAEFKPTTLINSIASGLIVGLIALVNTITYGVLIYSAAGDTARGVMLALINGLVLSLLFGLFGSIPGLVAFPQSAITPVFALLVSNVIILIPGESPEVVAASVLMAVLLATLMVSVAYILLGFRKLGIIIRFMPYPVSGGFLAGLGWLLLSSGFKVSVGEFSLKMLLNPEKLAFWIPALLLGMLLFFMQEKSAKTWITPAILSAAVALFYLINGTSVDHLRQAGWLLTLSEIKTHTLFQLPSLSLLGNVQWRVIFFNTTTAMTLLFTAMISMLLNINGIEMAIGTDIDPDRELRLAGFANLMAVLAGGGIVGYPSAGLTIMAYKRGRPGRLLNLVVAAMFAVTIFYGSQYLSYLPNFVIGGLLISLGVNFLYEWLVEGFFKFSITDYLVVLAIFLTVTLVNLLAGILLGLVLMVIIFVASYSNTSAIRSILTGRNFQSNVDRPMKHMQYLKERGEQIFILRLQGYIFFGTAHFIYQQVKDRLAEDSQPIRFVVLDFTQTYGVDSSAAMIFIKMQRLAKTYQFSLVFSSISEKILGKLARNGFQINENGLRSFENMDHAVEWCESMILFQSDMTVVTSRSLVENLGAYFNPEEYKALFEFMQRLDVSENYSLIKQGEESPGLYLVERGRITIYRELPNGLLFRLRSMGAGTAVGEMSLYTGGVASATAQTDIPSELYLLSPDAFRRMENEMPTLASKFHRYIVQLLGQRLQNTTASVQALLQ